MEKTKWNVVITNPEVLVLDDGVYNVVHIDDVNNLPEDFKPDWEFKNAYIDSGEFFYVFRGNLTKSSVLPGIYLDDKSFVIIPPSGDEKDAYAHANKIKNVDIGSISEAIKDRTNFNRSNNMMSKHYIPDITASDDILKRAIKIALKAKNVDFDMCSDNFPNRNAQFNLSSVIRGDKALSMKLFERACLALGLNFKIILQEKCDEGELGTSLKDKVRVYENIDGETNVKEYVKMDDEHISLSGSITVSSDDTYDI